MSEGTIAVMICGHGSRDDDATREFAAMVETLRARLPYPVEHGYLEFARPIIRDGLGKLAERGAKRILALPAMLFAAGHVKNDLPWELNTFRAETPGVAVDYGRDLGIDARMLRAASERIAVAEARSARKIDRADTVLVVVGRGTNDPDANSNIAKIMRMLWEGLGYGWGAVAYSGVAYPRVNAALARITRMGFKRVIVFPYFLFTGVLVRRIYDQTDEIAALAPDIEFIKADYLNDHPLVIDTMIDRVGEMLAGANVMNCLVCKYREQIIGYEREVGTPQAGHHLHVRGIGTNADHAHDHHHHHDHRHHHHGDHDHDHDHAHDHAHDHYRKNK
jgi:sirohydrochlorin cobaltochelatase